VIYLFVYLMYVDYSLLQAAVAAGYRGSGHIINVKATRIADDNWVVTTQVACLRCLWTAVLLQAAVAADSDGTGYDTIPKMTRIE
jgi:hypothetical protein